MPPEPFLSWFHTLFVLLRENDEKALFLLLLIEEAGIPLPLPGDTVIAFAGYQASIGRMGILEAALAVTLAVQIGSTILYLLSRKLGHTILFRYGRLIHLDPSRLEKIERWIQRHGAVMVLVGRLTPGLRTPTSIMSGVFEIPFHQFLAFTTVAAIMWSGFWLLVGYFFGRSLLPMLRHLHYPAFALSLLLLLALAALAFRRFHRSGPRSSLFGAAVDSRKRQQPPDQGQTDLPSTAMRATRQWPYWPDEPGPRT